MTAFIRGAKPEDVILDTEITDDVMAYVSVKELRRFSRDMQALGARKLRSAVRSKIGSRTSDILTKTIIDVTTL